MNLLKTIFGKTKDYELLANPNILFDNDVIADEITLCGHKIGDSVSDINLEKVDMTGLEIYPKKVGNRIWKDDKSYVKINGKEIEFTLAERIKAVVDKGGWLGYPNGARFRIENQVINFFSLHLDMLKPYKKYSKYQIKKKLGNNIKAKHTYEDFDGTLFRTDFFDLNRKTVIMWDDWDKKILLVTIGK